MHLGKMLAGEREEEFLHLMVDSKQGTSKGPEIRYNLQRLTPSDPFFLQLGTPSQTFHHFPK
jgi:hypothetical protein